MWLMSMVLQREPDRRKKKAIIKWLTKLAKPTSGNGVAFTNTFDRLDQLKQTVTQLGRSYKRTFDEKGNRNSELVGTLASRTNYYSFDPCGAVSAFMEPNSDQYMTQYEYHFSGELKMTHLPGGSILSNTEMTPFGVSLKTVLPDGTEITKVLDNKSQLRTKTSTGGPDYRQYMKLYSVTGHYFDAASSTLHTYDAWVPGSQIGYSMVPTPNQNLAYDYNTIGQLISVLDNAMSGSSTYAYDKNSRCIHREVKLINNLVRTMTMTLDPLGRKSFVRDTNATMNVSYDAASNRRNIVVNFQSQANGPYSASLWNTFDEANRPKVHEGSLVDKDIQPANGYEFTYQGNLRDTESCQGTLTKLFYDDDARLLTTSSNGIDTVRVYNVNGSEWVDKYYESTGYSNDLYYFDDGLQRQSILSRGQAQQSTQYTYNSTESLLNADTVITTHDSHGTHTSAINLK